MKSLSIITCILTVFASCFLISPSVNGQPIEADLVYQWGDTSITQTSWLDSRYNETWGVTVNGREIAIIGSTEGVHFIDITDENSIQELKEAFVPGRAVGQNLVHRDYHDYAGYLYTVADEGFSSLQIIDLSHLPDSTNVVYDEFEYITTAHNIFIDSTSALLYACGARPVSGGRFPLIVLSLDDPTAPELVANFNAIGPLSLPLIHDIFVRNDTAYLNGGPGGLIVAEFSDPENPTLLGTLTDYPDAGYNHSGWLSDDGNYYFMADETHGMDLKVVDVTDLQDMRVITLFNAEAIAQSSIPHNLLVNCNRLYVSYYYDGLQVYDISDPVNPIRIAYYDTYEGPDAAFFAGAWGVFPFSGSEKVVVSDMQGGLFVFDDIAGDDCAILTNVEEVPDMNLKMVVSPNPTYGTINISLPVNLEGEELTFNLFDLTGKLHWSQENQVINGQIQLDILVDQSGMYLLQCSGRSYMQTSRISLIKP